MMGVHVTDWWIPGPGEGPMSTWAVVVAAGAGSRFGARKQFERLGDRRVVDWSLAAASRACDGVVLVVAPGDRGEVEATFGCADRGPVVVTGGATRSASVRVGLAAVPGTAAIVVVHDAARPLASVELFERTIAAVLGGADAAVPGVAVVDTIRHVAGGTLDRETLVAVQTPQAFAASALRAAHRAGGEASDDASLVEARGGKVVVVPGERSNIKITTPTDLVIVRALAATPPEGR
jgi:2-C-methyl-D-erythritol 4-phosphate cytidylyltransferase